MVPLGVGLGLTACTQIRDLEWMSKRGPKPRFQPDFVFVDEATQRLGKSRRTLETWRRTGTMPEPVKVGPNSVGWPRQVFEDWVRSRSSVISVPQGHTNGAMYHVMVAQVGFSCTPEQLRILKLACDRAGVVGAIVSTEDVAIDCVCIIWPMAGNIQPVELRRRLETMNENGPLI